MLRIERFIIEFVREGSDLHVLQTARGGNAERFYEEIGFETDHTATWYIKSL